VEPRGCEVQQDCTILSLRREMMMKMTDSLRIMHETAFASIDRYLSKSSLLSQKLTDFNKGDLDPQPRICQTWAKRLDLKPTF
jgi:hypothetical protein